MKNLNKEEVVINISLGEGKNQSIRLNPNSKPQQIARSFAQTHKLSQIQEQKLKQTLVSHIPGSLFDPSRLFLSSTSTSTISDPKQPSIHSRLYQQSKYKIRNPNYRKRSQIPQQKPIIPRNIGSGQRGTNLYGSKKPFQRVQKRNPDLAQCSFQPCISPSSHKLGKQRGEIFEVLYRDSQIRERKQKEEVEIISSKSSTGDLSEFYKRLEQFKARHENKISQLTEKFHSNVDPKTGKPWFHPQVNQNQKLIRNQSVFESLYQKSRPKQIQPELAIQKVFKEKIHKLTKIFEKLDSDGDGLISYDCIDIDELDPSTL